MRKTISGSKRVEGVSRQGTPFTVYFSHEQAEAIAALSRERRVSKATLVRYAVERLLGQIHKGHGKSPLGL
jgi:hypothetical protein